MKLTPDLNEHRHGVNEHDLNEPEFYSSNLKRNMLHVICGITKMDSTVSFTTKSNSTKLLHQFRFNLTLNLNLK